MVNNLNSEIANINGRFLLDSYSKVVEYVLKASNEDEINLSNCIIKPHTDTPHFRFKELCKFVEGHDLLSQIGIEKDPESNQSYIVSRRLNCRNSILDEVFFDGITFKEWVGFEKSVITKSHFNKSVFLKGLSFYNIIIKNYLSCENCKIDNIYFHTVSFEGSGLDFRLCTIDSISISSSNFLYDSETLTEFATKPSLINLDINFAYSQIGDILISKTGSNLSFSFLGAKITGSTSFIDCKFDKGLYFEEAKLLGQQVVIENKEFVPPYSVMFINFDRAEIHSDIIINNIKCKFITASSTTIHREGRLCIYSSSIKDFFFTRATIYGELSILHLKNAAKLSLTYSINLGLVNIGLENLTIFDFDTAKILRHAAQKLNNNIEVTALKAIEHKLYLKGNKFKLTFSSIADYTLLYLNQLSSQFGTNWISGIIFCIIVSMISTGIISLTLGEYHFCLNVGDWAIFTNDFWRKSFEFLWLPYLQNFSELIVKSKCSAITIACYIAGKSLIAYGIFQIVSSFRKYSK